MVAADPHLAYLHVGPHTYDSLAAELGVGRERVRQLETSALQQLARAAAHDRYRPLRWRAVSAARPGGADAAAIPAHRRGWARCCPGWQGNPPDAGVVHPLSAHPASSALIMRARAFRASLEPVTPPLRNARRDTGFPAAASLRAITRA